VPARILVVCTANICRSPTVAGLLASRLPDVEVRSAGVRAKSGQEMCDVSRKWLLSQGVQTSHSSQHLTVADVRGSTLILTATRWHRAAVLELRPSAAVRTHTLMEAARVAEWYVSTGGSVPADDMNERVLWLAEVLHRSRGKAPGPRVLDDDDLADPHHGGKHVPALTQMLESTEELCNPLIYGRRLRLDSFADR
jgi:protein-tyrosine phosphatase